MKTIKQLEDEVTARRFVMDRADEEFRLASRRLEIVQRERDRCIAVWQEALRQLDAAQRAEGQR